MPTNTKQSIIAAAGINERSLFDFALVARLVRAIEGRITPLEAQRESLDGAIDAVQRVGLSRINEVLGPAIESVLRIQERGFLIARSDTSATLANGNILSFFINDLDERALFTPSPFTALTREDNAADYAVARTIAYDPSNGEFICQVVSFFGDAGPHSDWVIGALAGSTAAQYALLGEGQTIRDVVVAAREVSLGARDAALGHENAAAQSAGVAAGHAGAAADSAGAAANHAQAASGFASAAATFDPSTYYPKTETRTRLEITAEIADAVDALAVGAPGALDTLNELAAALGNDADFAATVTTALAGKQALSAKGQANGYASLDSTGRVPETQLPEIAGVASEYREFTSSGTWTKPAGVTWIYVEAIGGGGGGGGVNYGSTGQGRTAAPGGGGLFVSGVLRAEDIGLTVTAIVGSGGSGGNSGSNGTNGGASMFGSHLTAKGGTGGGGATTSSGGAAGLGGGLFDTHNYFGAGGVSSDSVKGGASGGTSYSSGSSSVDKRFGGKSQYGGDGGDGGIYESGNHVNGGNGQAPGGGGAGAANNQAGGSARGGNGGNGRVRVWAW